jgi:pilus assembly protein Flp/PilA
MRWFASVRSRLRRADDGQGLAEYSLILGLVAIVAVASLTSLGSAIAGSAGFSMF